MPIERPEHPIVKEHRDAYEKAMAAEKYEEAFNQLLAGVFKRACDMLERKGYQLVQEAPPKSPLDIAASLGNAMVREIEQLGEDSHALCAARDAFFAIADIHAYFELAPKEPETKAQVFSRLLLLGSHLGSNDVKLTLAALNHWDDFGSAMWMADRVRTGPRNRKVPWAEAFLPVAQNYCSGKTKVTLAALVRLAKHWGEKQRAVGKNPGLPSTEDGIEAGLKRLERKAQLLIPGRNKPPPGN